MREMKNPNSHRKQEHEQEQFHRSGLYSLGIPKDSILQYETALKTDKFVLIAHGSLAEATRAKEIPNHTKPEILEHHQ